MAGNAFWSGGLAGAVGIVVGQPLDTLRIRMQTKPATHNPLAGSGMLCTFRAMLRSEGMGGLYSGMTAPILASGARSACIFVGFDSTLRCLDGHRVSHHALAGAVGGLLAVPVTNPAELLKCQAQVRCKSLCVGPPGSLSVEWQLLRELWQHNGPRILTTGLPLTAIREVSFRSVYFPVAEKVACQLSGQRHGEGQRPIYVSFFAGSVAGMVSWLPIYPVDVLKTHWQTGQRYGAANFTELLSRGVKAEGLQWLYRGLGPTVLRAGVMNAVVFPMYQMLRR